MVDYKIEYLCSTLYNETNRPYWDDFQASQKDPEEWETCPYPTGPNEIRNFLIKDYGNFLPPYIPGGEKWRIDVRVLKDDEILGGYNLYATLRTQKSLMNG